MDRFSDIYAPIIGRVLVGGYFLWEGIVNALNFATTVQLLASAGVPAPVVFGVLAVAVEVLGGIALITGFKTSQTALLLAVFSVVTSFLYITLNSPLALSLFLQNMAIVGGLLYISAFGNGAWDPGWHYKKRK